MGSHVGRVAARTTVVGARAAALRRPRVEPFTDLESSEAICDAGAEPRDPKELRRLTVDV